MIDVGIKDLCAKAEVTPRTVHFYIQQGLLAPPEGAGRGARYSEAHLARLRLIRRLQKEHLPLNEIRRRLDALSDEQVVQALAGGTASPAGTKQSALDYIQSVTARARSGRRASHAPRPTLDAVASLKPDGATRSSTHHSHWDRIVLDEDVELHIRRPLSRERNRFVDKLLAFAKQVTKEEQS